MRSFLFHTDKCFKLGASWDTIVGIGVTRVILLHIGPFVISFADRLEGERLKNFMLKRSVSYEKRTKNASSAAYGAIILALLLTSCNPYIDTKRGIVSAGFMSTTQGFSGKMKTAEGATVAWSVLNTDSTSVPNNALGTISTVSAASNLLKGRQSDNLFKTAKDANATTIAGKKIESATVLGQGAQKADAIKNAPQAVAPGATILNPP